MIHALAIFYTFGALVAWFRPFWYLGFSDTWKEFTEDPSFPKTRHPMTLAWVRLIMTLGWPGLFFYCMYLACSNRDP